MSTDFRVWELVSGGTTMGLWHMVYCPSCREMSVTATGDQQARALLAHGALHTAGITPPPFWGEKPANQITQDEILDFMLDIQAVDMKLVWKELSESS